MLTEKFLEAVTEAFMPHDSIIISIEKGIFCFGIGLDSFYIDKDFNVFYHDFNYPPRQNSDLTLTIKCNLCGLKTIITEAGNLKKEIDVFSITEILEDVEADGVDCDFLFKEETLYITTIKTPYSIKSIFEDNFDKQNDPHYYDEEDLDDRDCLESGTGQWAHN